tara:strand:+ start:1661 stop:3058 length:1398 start_codon:yes stop_codon:yes gene_type:complete
MSQLDSNVSFSEYGTSFQEKIVQAFLTDHKWSAQMSEVIKIDYFDLKYLRFLADRFFQYHVKYKCFPTFHLLISIVRDDLREGTDIILRDKIIEYLHRTKTNPDMGDMQYVKDKSLDFCKKQALKEALVKAVDAISSGQDENVLSIIQEAMSAGSSPSLGHDFSDDFEFRFTETFRRTCPTGLDKLDSKDVLGGGLARGELGVIVANTGVGKSHMLVQLGATAVALGKNVVHYTFELTEGSVGLRYDSNICKIPKNDIIDRKDEVKKTYEKMELGRLIIKEYPTGTASIVTLRNHLDKLLLKGIKPDLLVVDYADIMRSTRKYDSLRHELKLIYEELRNLAMELEIPVWTASQANRDSAHSDVVGLENMSEAYGKAMVADVVLSISRKSSEKSQGTGRMFIAKNRAGRDGLLYPVKIDTGRSMIRILSDDEIIDADLEKKRFETTMKNLLKEKWKEVSSQKTTEN